MQTETKGLIVPCIQCGTELEDSAMLEFGGGVACEKCFRDYYEKAYPLGEFPAELRKEGIEEELRTRRMGAVRWLKYNRQRLEKQAAKKVKW